MRLLDLPERTETACQPRPPHAAGRGERRRHGAAGRRRGRGVQTDRHMEILPPRRHPTVEGGHDPVAFVCAADAHHVVRGEVQDTGKRF